MEVTGKIAKVISAGVPADELRKAALQEGMVTLRDAGLEKMRQGVTSAEEVFKRTTVTKATVPAYLANPEIEHYHDKDIIFREGMKGPHFFKLVQGVLVVIKDRRKIGEITEPGEYFGEMAALTGEPRSATVVSKGRSVIERFPGDKISEIMENHPDIAKRILETIAGRLHKANSVVVRLIKNNQRLQNNKNQLLN